MEMKERRRQNLIKLVDEYGSQQSLADVVDMTPAVFSQIIKKRRNMGEKLARSIEGRLGRPKGWFDRSTAIENKTPSTHAVVEQGAESSTSNEENYLINSIPASTINMFDLMVWDDPKDLPSDLFEWVPVYNVSLSAGTGRMVESEVSERSLPFITSWLNRMGIQSNRAALVYVDGESMEPRISNGAMVLIDRSNTAIKNGCVYAIRIGEEVLIKRLFVEVGGAIVVRSDNNAIEYPEQRIEKSGLSELAIIGRVIWQGAMVK